MALPFLLFAGQSSERDWENWDSDEVAKSIDKYWQNEKMEKNWRKVLGHFSANYIGNDDIVLEVGCGSGLIYKEIVPNLIDNANYVGIDVSYKMLDIAHERYPNGNFLYGDVYNMEFEDETFDVTIAYEVLCHIRNIEKPISEMCRVAKRQVIFTVWESKKTFISEEVIDGIHFIHYSYSPSDMMKIIESATSGRYSVSRIPMKGRSAYIINKF